MSQATYILTYRADRDGQRRRNLEAVLAWLAGFAQIDVVVVEQDAAPTPLTLPHPRCQAVFAYNPGPFNKSWGFNVGFRAAQTQWLGFGDADVIVGDALWQSFELLRQGLLAVKPYRRLIDMSEEESKPVRAARAWASTSYSRAAASSSIEMHSSRSAAGTSASSVGGARTTRSRTGSSAAA